MRPLSRNQGSSSLLLVQGVVSPHRGASSVTLQITCLYANESKTVGHATDACDKIISTAKAPPPACIRNIRTALVHRF
jgi:hypothetical protein